jgi:hypothetical protein
LSIKAKIIVIKNGLTTGGVSPFHIYRLLYQRLSELSTIQQ